MFIGRKLELDFLESRYHAENGQLVFVYGRRRVGKTELLRKFCEGKNHVFYSCVETTDDRQLASFSARVLSKGGPAARYLASFPDWRSAFEAVSEIPGAGKTVLVIDEFPYMARRNSGIPSILQAVWDETLKDKNVMLVLCGSAMSYIEKEVLSSKNPLYGRATGILKILPMEYLDASCFFPDYSPADKIAAYAVLGGIPHYLKQFNGKKSLAQNIKEAILTRGSALYSETEFLLRQELRDPAVYNTVIQAVATGSTKLNEIFGKTLVDKTSLSVYIKNLLSLGILQREFPVDVGIGESANVHRGLYCLSDSFFRFWYSFVFPNLPELEAGDVDGIWSHLVAPALDKFVSISFEDVCRQYLRKLNREEALPFHFSRLGRWWNDADEIDIVAFGGGRTLLGECKYKKGVFALSELRHFLCKPFPGKDNNPIRWLFSKGGFSKEVVGEAGTAGIRTVELSDLFDDVSNLASHAMPKPE